MERRRRHGWYDGRWYRLLIDPLLGGERSAAVVRLLRAGETLLDYGCGTGALSRYCSRAGLRVTGADISPLMIKEARRLGGAEYVLLDAYLPASPPLAARYDAAVIRLVLHENDPAQAEVILSRLGGLAGRVIIVEWNTGAGLIRRALMEMIEFLAGVRHYRNYRAWRRGGGIDALLARSGFQELSRSVHAGGMLVIVEAVSAAKR